MHIKFLNGTKFSGDWRNFNRALWHPLFVAQVLGMSGVILVLNPYDRFMPEAMIPRGLIVSSSIVMFLLVSIFLMSQSKRWPIFSPTYSVIVLAVLVASLWGVSASVFMGGQALGLAEWLQLLAFNTVYCTLGEIFLASFLLARIAEESGMRAFSNVKNAGGARQTLHAVTEVPPSVSNPVSERPKWLEVLGQKLATDEIWHLKSEEHYVAVRLRDDRSLLLRGRLIDAIAQLPTEAGMQVHRSHWIACDALAGLRCTRDGCRLRLHGGQEVPIARNRLPEVRPWAKALLQEV